MYLVLCACIIYTYNTKQTRIHTQFIYYFSLCIKSIYRYMYINYSGSQIIYGELILYLAEQYLLLHKDHRFRSGGVLFFIFIFILLFYFFLLECC